MKETNTKSSLAERALSGLAAAVYHRPRLFFYPQVVLFLVSVCFTVARLEFSTSRNDLVGADKKYHQNYLKFKEEFPTQEDLVVIVESDRMEKNRQFVERLGARLEAETNLFQNVFYKGDLKMLGTKALMFLPREDLESLLKQLREFRPFVEKFSTATNLVSLVQVLNTQFRTAGNKPEAEVKPLLDGLPALERIVRQAAANLSRPGVPPSPGITALFGGGPEAEREMYITFGNGRIYLATAQARNPHVGEDSVRRLRELVEEIRREIPGVSVGVTGEPILEFDEMAQSQADTLTASVVSLVLVALIFIYGYQATGRPIKATACLLVGLGYTMGYTTLVVGHLNILTITFAPMLIGLAIDFGVHLITRYEEELRGGRPEREAIRVAMVRTGQGIFTGALTTAAAFFAMAMTDFKGIQEMGVIAGGGLLISLVPMMTLLPVLLLRGRQNVLDHRAPAAFDLRGNLERLWLSRPGMVALTTVVLCALAAFQMRRVHFDYNLLNMQSAQLPAVVFEKKLLESASNSVLFGALVARTLGEATELEQRVRRLPSVADVQSMSRYLVQRPEEKDALIEQVRQEAATLTFTPVDREPADVRELSQVLYSFQGYLGAAADQVAKEGQPGIHRSLRALWEQIQDWRNQLNQMDASTAARQTASYQQALLDDLRETFGALQRQQTGAVRAGDLPPALRNRFIGLNGHYLLQVYPRRDVWQRVHQEEFVSELRTIDPEVTGTPVQLLEYTSLLKESYVEAAGYALGAAALMVLIHFRSAICMLLSLVPVLVGTIWMTGVMGWLGIPFNPANIMTLPLVAGIGVTSGIHILNRFSEERDASVLGKSTGKAVLVSGLTTIAGFGSLTLAEHQGIQSLGFVMAVGTTTCMLAALTFLPALLSLLTRFGWAKKEPSDSNAPYAAGL